MQIVESIVISKKIQNDDSLVKSFLLSLGLHVGILYLALHVNLFKKSQVILLEAQEKSFSVSLNNMDFDKERTIPNIKREHDTQKSKQMNHRQTQNRTNEVKSMPDTHETQHESKTPQKIEPATTTKAVQSSEAFTPQQISNTEHNEKASIVEKSLSKNLNSPSISKTAPKKAQKFDIGKEQLAHIRTMIENALIYPAIAKKLRLEGVVTVSFSLRPDGYVQDIQIVSSSGSSVLDNKAIATISSLNGEYPHLEQKVDLSLPIAFSLHNS